MESRIPGIRSHVRCERVADSRGVRRFIDKHVVDWIERRLGSGVPVSDVGGASYFASFDRQGRGHTVLCRLEVRLGPETWAATEIEDDVHQALIRCLENMVPTGLFLSQPVPAPA